MKRASKIGTDLFSEAMVSDLDQLERAYKRAERDARAQEKRRLEMIKEIEEEMKEDARAKRKIRDKTRPVCRCAAYPWPHRPNSGFCRHPDPPTEQYQRKPRSRPYRARYIGTFRDLLRRYGVHPIRDRKFIKTLNPDLLE